MAPFFVAVFAFLIYRLTPILKSYDFIFSFSINALLDLILLAVLICLSSFLFVVFACFSQNLRFTLPVSIFAALIPMLFQDPAIALILAVAIFVSFLLTSLNLNNTLKSYLTFQPGALLNPSVKHLSGLLILSFCLIYFLQISKVISQKGFQIPDTLIEATLKFSGSDQIQTSTPQLSIPSDQIELLKKNPDLLKQSGLDPKILDNLNPNSNNLIKQTVKDQIQTIIKPYQNIIPAILAVLLFLTLQSLTSILNLLIYPLLWLFFLILEKIGFVKFEIEQRPVKKMVI